MSWLKSLFGSNSEPEKNEPHQKRFVHPVAAMEEAFKAHGDELNGTLTAENKKNALMTWRSYIDEHQHDFADLVAHDPKSEQLAKLEADVIMRTFLCGVMAKRGWIEEMTAKQVPFMLGRALRDQIRAMGIPLEQKVNANAGTSIDMALMQVLEVGMKAGASKS
ncbi:MAG TPA: hypothetical protein VEJ63_05000 [Planctomycetota bacterium]|nr:hypothetical protein [Planctomycetota bacterium]